MRKGKQKTNTEVFGELMAGITDESLYSHIKKIDSFCYHNNFTEAIKLAKKTLPADKAEILNEYAEYKLLFTISTGYDGEYIKILNSYKYSEAYLKSKDFLQAIDSLLINYKRDISGLRKEHPERAKEAIKGITFLSKYKKIDLTGLI